MYACSPAKLLDKQILSACDSWGYAVVQVAPATNGSQLTQSIIRRVKTHELVRALGAMLESSPSNTREKDSRPASTRSSSRSLFFSCDINIFKRTTNG
jgi:hypothetical protein